ncbi:MAG: hypothetical protein ABSE73_08755 [Planctomycetota bacterium]
MLLQSKVLSLCLCVSVVNVAVAQEIPAFDFTKPADTEGWQAAHDISKMEATPEGLRVQISGGDPYVIGPSRDYPADAMLLLKVRLKSEQGGDLQIFYFNTNATEENSVHMPSKAGDWEELEAVLPPLGPKYHLRIDPPGSGGTAIIGGLWFKAMPVLKEPEWPKPEPPAVEKDALTIKSGDLELAHAPGALGAFVLRVKGKDMACGNTRPLIGYLHEGKQYWIDVAKEAKVSIIGKGSSSLTVQASLKDSHGGAWVICQWFSRTKTVLVNDEDKELVDAIHVQTEAQVSQDRQIAYLPLLMVLPGAGSFGEKKGQGLFAGLEYLDNEPSSSEADIVGAASKRQVPDLVKITFPLMAIQNEGRYIGLISGCRFMPGLGAKNILDENKSLLFDSPDRLFHSGGHVMGLIFPGSDGRNRAEGSLLPRYPKLLKGAGDVAPGATFNVGVGDLLHCEATLIGGRAESMVPAVQQYIALRGLPLCFLSPPKGPVHDPMDFQPYVSLASSGWLDSKIREDGLIRHAVWPGFKAQAAADAAFWMAWLAAQTKTPELAERLRAAATEVLAKVPPQNYNGAAVSHVRFPAVSLYYGHVAENVKAAENGARGLLAAFEPDGSVRYKKAPGRPDYAKTSPVPEANGLAAGNVVHLLESAALCGNRELVKEALRVLRALNKFDNTVPRGAQTWEVPLHTPDILASAHLVKAYTLGYELTGEREFLDRAVYWAWTGVPFVYLVNPTPKPVGTYATIAVLGATNWQAPVWFGQPVQWCGLVYADALYGLARHVPGGPWKQLADGITACGIQFTWPQQDKDRQGLLPDFYHLRQQVSDGPAINPGTVQANAVRLYGQPPVYSFHASRENGWYIHVPGELSDVVERKGQVSFKVRCALDQAYYVLVSGLEAQPRVRLNEEDAVLGQAHQFVAESGWLILRLTGSTKIEIMADR